MAGLLRATGEVITLQPAGRTFTLKELQGLVGGYIECVTLLDGRRMVLNEDGKRLQLPLNEAATHLLHVAGGALDDFVVGDVLLATRAELGEGDDDA